MGGMLLMHVMFPYMHDLVHLTEEQYKLVNYVHIPLLVAKISYSAE